MKAKFIGQPGSRNPKANTNEITFNVERDEQDGWLTASWDAPRGQGTENFAKRAASGRRQRGAVHKRFVTPAVDYGS